MTHHLRNCRYSVVPLACFAMAIIVTVILSWLLAAFVDPRYSKNKNVGIVRDYGARELWHISDYVRCGARELIISRSPKDFTRLEFMPIPQQILLDTIPRGAYLHHAERIPTGRLVISERSYGIPLRCMSYAIINTGVGMKWNLQIASIRETTQFVSSKNCIDPRG